MKKPSGDDKGPSLYLNILLIEKDVYFHHNPFRLQSVPWLPSTATRKVRNTSVIPLNRQKPYITTVYRVSSSKFLWGLKAGENWVWPTTGRSIEATTSMCMN